jgi:methanogenic corrinoid protein MtbC1
MVNENLLENYLDALLTGDRNASRKVIEKALQTGIPANNVYMDIVWPIMVEVDRLWRADKITSAQESFATRINRTIVDQLQNKLPCREITEKKIVVYSASSEQGELGAQMIVDLFESNGWETRFLGGSVSTDDVMAFTQQYNPDILLVYGMNADRAPEVRQLINKTRQINAHPDMQIMLSGGVFDRAEGLWEEIGADLYAENPAQAIKIASMSREDQPKPVRTINRRKRASKTNSTEELAAEMAV